MEANKINGKTLIPATHRNEGRRKTERNQLIKNK